MASIVGKLKKEVSSTFILEFWRADFGLVKEDNLKGSGAGHLHLLKDKSDGNQTRLAESDKAGRTEGFS